MSRKRRKNKKRKGSDSEDYEQLPFVCRCQKVFRKPLSKNDSESKEEEIGNSVYQKWNSGTDETLSRSREMQTKSFKCEESSQEIVHGEGNELEDGRIRSTPNETENVMKVKLTDNASLQMGERNELCTNPDEQTESGGTTTAQVKSNCVHVNLEIKNESASKGGTHILITNQKNLKKSRSYHDRQHLQSWHNENCTWDFAGDSSKTDQGHSKNKRQDSEKPFIKLEIIGEGIEIKYKTVNQDLLVCIEADKVRKETEDIFSNSYAHNADYLSPEGSCNSYPVSDFSVHERKEFCANYVSPEWHVDVPPPEEFADGELINTIPKDEALHFEDSVKDSCSMPSISSSWSELETEHKQEKDADCTVENGAKQGETVPLQHLTGCAHKIIKPNKIRLSQASFISNQEFQSSPSGCCNSIKNNWPFDTKMIRRKTFPEMYCGSPRTISSHSKEAVFDSEDQSLSSKVLPELPIPSNSVTSGPVLSSVDISCDPYDHITPKSNHEESIDVFVEDFRVIYSHDDGNRPQEINYSETSSLCPQENVDVGMNTADEEEDFEDLLKHADERIEFTESGFDEEMLDSDNHTDLLESQNKSFMFQIIPPSPSTSKEYGIEKSKSSKTSTEQDLEMQARDVSQDKTQSSVTDTEMATRKRKGSVVTVVTQDFEQRLLIQNDNHALSDVITSRAQKESKQLYLIKRDSVLTPVPDVEEPNQDTKVHSSFEDHNSLIYEDISAQTSQTFDPFLSIENQYNEPEDTSIKEATETACPELLEESNEMFDNFQQDDISPRNSSDSAMPGTSIESMACQVPCLAKSDSEENGHKCENKDESSAKPGSPRKKAFKKDTRSDMFSKHLKLPKDSVLKESRGCESSQEEASDRWAKKRKQFKEMKNCNSAGGSSLTSNITEESGNSEETRSVDLAIRSENKDKALYTESFHSASWIFRGDDASPDNSPRCLSKRPRSVAIRERTVRIAKGTGDYPWGFRIQFSKPILVTEVDTNGAAEEAGLQVGDIVMAVNGTDVTSIPHSEAATLAQQGPDLLTLVVGSDISRFPNTPRPTCRGYLHKRTHSGLLKGWRKRWFVLKHDGSLHYYKQKKINLVECVLLQTCSMVDIL
ncbi:uncharacterized protein LOC128472450 [Spea bombifrons]|uniref:uncharacterized protein LOC128472450 n=1 Tax=Spea bombifrons TaxID=233779 RepID=UPI00234A09C7|nr:uncharacterized protein LOC128472450 [Spea bombifrons]